MTARYRTSGGIKAKPIPGTFDTWTNNLVCSNAPTWSSMVTNYADWVGTYQQMTDFVVPGFHKARSRGEVFFNPMFKSVMTFEPATGTSGHNISNTQNCVGYAYPFYAQWRFQNAHQVLFSNYYNSSTVLLASPMTDAERINVANEAITSCLANRGRSSNNLYETVAEAHKLLGALTTVLKDLAQWLHANKDIVSKARDSSSGYLAYRYGIAPFISDIEAIIAGAKEIEGVKRETARGSATLTKSSSSTGGYVSVAGMQSVKHTVTLTETYSVRAMALDEYRATLLDNLGFRTKGLLGLPWELTSYSFVVDWFTNIGDFIYGILPFIGSTQLGSCYVARSEKTLIDTAHSAVPTSGQSIIVPFSGSKKITQTTTHRVVDIGAPTIVIRNDFRLDTLKRALDACALVVQRLR